MSAGQLGAFAGQILEGFRAVSRFVSVGDDKPIVAQLLRVGDGDGNLVLSRRQIRQGAAIALHHGVESQFTDGRLERELDQTIVFAADLLREIGQLDRLERLTAVQRNLGFIDAVGDAGLCDS